MTQKFLDDFGIFPVGIQDRPKGVPKGMPADPLLESCPLSTRPDTLVPNADMILSVDLNTP